MYDFDTCFKFDHKTQVCKSRFSNRMTLKPSTVTFHSWAIVRKDSTIKKSLLFPSKSHFWKHSRYLLLQRIFTGLRILALDLRLQKQTHQNTSQWITPHGWRSNFPLLPLPPPFTLPTITSCERCSTGPQCLITYVPWGAVVEAGIRSGRWFWWGREGCQTQTIDGMRSNLMRKLMNNLYIFSDKQAI